MSTDIVPTHERFGSTVDLFMNPDRYSAFKSMATVMFAGARSLGFITQQFQDGQQVQAAMMIALSMGRDPIQALQYAMPMPKGKMGWDYKWLMSVAEERAPQYRWGVIEAIPGAKFRGWMQASPTHPKYESEYTIEMAKKANLVRADSAWETQTDDMLFKSWWLRSGRRVIPSAMMGISIYDVEFADDSLPVIPETVATAPAVQADSPAPPAAPAAPSPVQGEYDWKGEFLGLAKKHGWNPKDGPKMKELLETLLAVDGTVTKYKSAASVPASDWRLGVQKLRAKYEPGASDAQVVEDDKATGNTGGTTPTPVAATEAAPVADESDDAPEPEAPASDEDGAAALEAQRSDPAFLMSLCLELEKAWKSPGALVKSGLKDKTKMWFTNTEMLGAIGSETEEGGVQPLAFFQTNDPRKMLDAKRTYALCHQVTKALDTHRNGGRPAPAQQS